MKRKIIQIDESKCTGCGQCIPKCKMSVLKIIDGKARLFSDVFCDGLGGCIKSCPLGAITIVEREVEAFDQKAAREHAQKEDNSSSLTPGVTASPKGEKQSLEQGIADSLSNLPIKLKLVPAIALFLQDADLIIAAECVDFSAANFHQDFLTGKILLEVCPKVDDIEIYREKINQIVKNNDIKSITYVYIKIPCCTDLTGIINDAIAASGKKIPFQTMSVEDNRQQ